MKTSLLCPITSMLKGYPFEVPLPTGSAVSGVVLADRVESTDWCARHARFEGYAARRVADEVLAKVNVLLR